MKFLLSVLTAVLLISGCASPVTSTEPPATRSSEIPVLTEAPTDQAATAMPAVAASPSPSPSPTQQPTPEPEPDTQPIGSFMLLQNYYLSLQTYFGKDWDGVNIHGMDYDPVNGQIALSGCVHKCDSVMNGYAYLLLVDATQQEPPQGLAIDRSARLRDAVFTPDGNRILYTTRQGIMAYNLAGGTARLIYPITTDRYLPIIDISPGGQYLASDANGTLTILQLDNLQEVALFPGDKTRYYHTEYFNAAGNRVLVSRTEDSLSFAVYEIASQNLVREVVTTKPSTAALSPDGSALAIASLEGGLVSLIDLSSGETFRQIDPRMKSIKKMAFSPANGDLFITGVADDTTSMFNNIRYFDPQTGEEKGQLLTYIDYYALTFAADGASLVTVSSPSIGLWSAENDRQRRSADLVREYFDAVVSGDYQRAAEMTRLDDYAVMEVEDLGLNPDDLVGVFTTLCAEDEVPCLPLGEIAAVNASDGEYWDYEALVTLALPDGSTYLYDGIEPYEFVGVKFDAQGNPFIASLHPGMRFPFP